MTSHEMHLDASLGWGAGTAAAAGSTFAAGDLASSGAITLCEELRLERWAARTVAIAARPLDVRCVSGTLLVTCEGDPQDHVLAAGEALRVAGAGRVVVAGLEAGVARATGPVARSALRAGSATRGARLFRRRRAWLGGVGLLALAVAVVFSTRAGRSSRASPAPPRPEVAAAAGCPCPNAP